MYTYINIYFSYSVIPTDQEDLTEDVYNFDEEDEDDVVDLVGLNSSQPMWVFPLYALLPAHEQAKVNVQCTLCFFMQMILVKSN